MIDFRRVNSKLSYRRQLLLIINLDNYFIGSINIVLSASYIPHSFFIWSSVTFLDEKAKWATFQVYSKRVVVQFTENGLVGHSVIRRDNYRNEIFIANMSVFCHIIPRFANKPTLRQKHTINFPIINSYLAVIREVLRRNNSILH